MSGGSFNYACHQADDNRVFEFLPEFKNMERWLRDNGKHDAADEVYAFILLVETCQRRLRLAGQRISDLLHSVEWTASGDTLMKAVDDSYAALIAPTNAQEDNQEGA